MASVHPHITPALAAFIEEQPVFFVGSAPLSASGRVNLSPKGLDCFRVLDERTVAYLDLTGSGNETAAHLTENGRITFMFCAFAGAPRILRLYGTGAVIQPGHEAWQDLLALFPPVAGVRQIIRARISRVQTSCGFGVPEMEFRGHRDKLPQWAARRGENGLREYRATHNALSIDDLPAPLP